MSKSKKILLADNKESFRETCVEFLQLRGFQATGVAAPEECLSTVETNPPHLVILDLRMRNDEDEGDLSGLILAKHLPSRLPKIILTAFPTWEMTRAALLATEQELPSATFFVSKLEGLGVLQRYVERTFDEYVRLNWELQIDWKTENRSSFTRLIEPELEESLLSHRTEELEDLLCRLFLNAAKVEFDRVLWEQTGLLTLQVCVSVIGKAPKPVLVICGKRNFVQLDAAIYLQHALQARSPSFPSMRTQMAETIHYAANCYALNGNLPSGVSSLQELYQQVGLEQASAGLLIDVENQSAWVNGRLLKLTVQEFRLLSFLYDRANQLCTRREIIEVFFEYRYDKLDGTQNTLINTNISRLRTELEVDPQNPRYLQTVRGRGYCLMLKD